MILFIASLIVAASVSGVFVNGVQRLSGALGAKSVDVSANVRTNIDIISDPGAHNIYNSTDKNITVLIKNTGSQQLDPTPGGMDVLVDGRYATSTSVSVIGGGSWDPGNVVKLTINMSSNPLANGDHRVFVIVNGDREVLRFKTP